MIFMFWADRRRFKQKWGWLALFVLYMNEMLIIIGMPAFTYVVWNPSINWIPFQNLSGSNLT